MNSMFMKIICDDLRDTKFWDRRGSLENSPDPNMGYLAFLNLHPNVTDFYYPQNEVAGR